MARPKRSTPPPHLVPLVARLPAAIHAAVQAMAAQDRRSLNAELITLLEEAMAAREYEAQARAGTLQLTTPHQPRIESGARPATAP